MFLSIQMEFAKVTVEDSSAVARYLLRVPNASLTFSMLSSGVPTTLVICLRVLPLAPFATIANASDKLIGEIHIFSFGLAKESTFAKRGNAIWVEALNDADATGLFGQGVGTSFSLTQLVDVSRIAVIINIE